MENHNSVAFIAKVKEILPIEGADKIELVICNDWSTVSTKNIHKVGNLVLCITTDAVIPEELAIEWNVVNYLRKGNRVRTIKLKGVYSECILISLENCKQELSKFLTPGIGWDLLNEGQDLMEDLKIFKYEPPVNTHVGLSTEPKKRYHQNPNFHIYYKFPNQKNVPNMFNEEDKVVITRKIHGANARYGIVKKSKLTFWDKVKRFFGDKWVEYEFVYGSHNVEKGSESQGFYSTDVWKTIADKYNIKDKLWKWVKEYSDNNTLESGIILYGEIYGPGIQGDKYSYNLKEIAFAAFDIELNDTYINYNYFSKITDDVNIPTAELLYIGNYNEMLKIKWSNDFIENSEVCHEGVVIKCISGSRNKIAKIISPNYLIYSEKNNIPDNY